MPAGQCTEEPKLQLRRIAPRAVRVACVIGSRGLSGGQEPMHPLVPSLAADAVRAAQPCLVATASCQPVLYELLALLRRSSVLPRHLGSVTHQVG